MSQAAVRTPDDDRVEEFDCGTEVRNIGKVDAIMLINFSFGQRQTMKCKQASE